jgi:hypothetical protein
MFRQASTRHRWYAVATSLLAATLGLALARVATAERVLVTYDEAARHGLERAWFAQIPVDPGRSRASTWYLHEDQIYCVTDSGLVTSLNAETGAALWTQQVGRPGVPAFGPEANSKFVGVVSGSRLYMLERDTGRLKWSRDLGSAPSSGPALSEDYAFVALVTGRIEGYKIDEPESQPWYYQSKGRTYLRPTTTGTIVSWPTTEGYLYVSAADEPGVRFRLETNDDIVTSPAEMAPYLYVASLDGYLYCLNEADGFEEWRYATGYPVMSSPALVGDHAYVASIEPALHCIDAATGESRWIASGVSHFGAQGKQRVYASGRYGELIILDAKTGSLVGRLRTAEGLKTLVNDQNDRIYLVNDRGLVQCLREIGAVEPTVYRKPPAQPEDGATEKPTGEVNPFEQAEQEAEAEEAAEPVDDAAPAEEDPAEDADDAEDAPLDDNPFE